MAALKTPVPYTPTILIVDDEESVRRHFGRTLEGLGYYVIEAANGRQAESIARERFLDVMILDLSMPEEDGIEVIRSIRNELSEIKVLVVSGFMLGSLVDIARKLGANRTLLKPVSEDALVDGVCRLLA